MTRFLIVSDDLPLRAELAQRLQAAFIHAQCREVSTGEDFMTALTSGDGCNLIVGATGGAVGVGTAVDSFWPACRRIAPLVWVLGVEEPRPSEWREGLRVLHRQQLDYLEESVRDCLEIAMLRGELGRMRERLQAAEARVRQLEPARLAVTDAALPTELPVQLETLLKLMVEPAIYVDREGQLQWTNAAAQATLGNPMMQLYQDELSARVALRMPDGTLVSEATLPAARALRGELVHEELYLLTREDGEVFFTCTSAAPVRVDGQIVGALLVWHDITEQERLLEEYHEQQRLLEQLVNLAPMGITVLQGPEFRFEYVNPFYQMLFGFDMPPLVGKTVAEVMSWSFGQLGFETLQRVYETGRPANIRQNEALLGPGQEPTYWDVDYVPLFGNDGRPAQVLVLTHEVTEQVRARREAESLAARDEAIMNSITEALVIIDSGGQIMQINPAARQLYWGVAVPKLPLTVAALAATYEFETLTGQLLDVEAWPLMRVLLGGTFRDWEIRMRSLDRGGEQIISYSGAPVRDPSGKITLGVVTARDVTMQKQITLEREALLAEVEQQQRETQTMAEILEREQWKLQIIMENTHAQLAYLDPDFNFISANSAYARGAGYSAIELVGRNHFELFPHAENQAIFEQVRRTGIPVSLTAKPFVHPKRPESPVTYWDWTLVPVKTIDGRVEGFVFSLLDVTEREIIRQGRERYLERLNALIRASNAVLTEQSVEGMLRRVVEAARDLLDARICTATYGYQSGFFKCSMVSMGPEPTVGSCRQGIRVEPDTVYGELIEGEANSIRLSGAEVRMRPAGWAGVIDGATPPRSLLGVRMVDYAMLLTGVIVVVDRRQGEFTPEDEALLTQLAALASVGLQHIEARQDAERRADELDAIFAAMIDGVIVFGGNGLPVRANPAADTVYGNQLLTMDRATGTHRIGLRYSDGELVPVDQLPSTRALAGEKVVNERLLMTDISENDRTVLVSVTPLSQGAEIIGAVLVWRDITEREEMLAQLDAERARFKAVIENAPEGILVIDEACRVVLSNPAAGRIFARPIPEGMNFARQNGLLLCDSAGVLYDPHDLPLVQSALEGGTFTNVEMRVLEPGDEWRHLLFSSAPIRNRGAGWSGAVAVVQDVTESKRIQEALRRYADLLQLLRRIDQAIQEAQSVEAIVGVALDYLPQMIPCLRVSVAIFDFETSRASLMATHSDPSLFSECNSWQGPLAELWFVSTLAEGRIYWTADLQSVTLKTDSSLLHMLQRIGIRGYFCVPLVAQGRLIGSINVGQRAAEAPEDEDVLLGREVAGPLAIGIQQVRLREQIARYAHELESLVDQRTLALQTSEARFRAIFEHAALGVVLMDIAGEIVESNPALHALLGYTAEELRASRLLNFVHPDSIETHQRFFEELMTGKRELYATEECYCRKNGGTVLASLSGSVIRESTGNPRHVVLLIKDITEQKQIEAALIQSEKLAMAGKLAASLAHEINNPLQAVIGCLGLAEEALQEGGDTQRYLRVAGDELLRAARIVGQLRDLNRQPLSEGRELTNINELVERVLVLSRKQCANQQVEVSWQPDPEALPLRVAGDQLVQVFLNLVLNALEAMPCGGRLSIYSTMTGDPGGIQLVFQDTGEGIPEDVLPNIFTPFYTTKSEGLGLGLFICQNIVAAHRGYIRAESKIGEGTVFTLWLPALDDANGQRRELR